jgi:hypothetical protein
MPPGGQDSGAVDISRPQPSATRRRWVTGLASVLLVSRRVGPMSTHQLKVALYFSMLGTSISAEMRPPSTKLDDVLRGRKRWSPQTASFCTPSCTHVTIGGAGALRCAASPVSHSVVGNALTARCRVVPPRITPSACSGTPPCHRRAAASSRCRCGPRTRYPWQLPSPSGIWRRLAFRTRLPRQGRSRAR